MRSTDDHPLYRLLALCARIECDAAQSDAIARAAFGVTTWEPLPSLAEAHGIAPLVYHHLTAADVPLPRAIKRAMQALVMRHRLASQIRTRVLREIVARYQAAELRVLLLKGAALAYALYPEPGLRPMRDLDLLVRPADALRAQQLLGDLGFVAFMPADEKNVPHRHLSPATLVRDGLTISVEIHRTLFESGAAPFSFELDDLRELVSVPLADCSAWTLGYAETLWYLCQHLIESTNVFSAPGLIWVADIISLVERLGAQIDWARIRSTFPQVLDTLALLHFLTPLSDAVLARAQITIGAEPRDLWPMFEKLPRTTPEEQMQQGYRRTLRAAIFPSAWWVRLHLGLGSARPLRWYHRAQYWKYLAVRFAHVQQRQWRAREK